jgi:hypothetical protein
VTPIFDLSPSPASADEVHVRSVAGTRQVHHRSPGTSQAGSGSLPVRERRGEPPPGVCALPAEVRLGAPRSGWAARAFRRILRLGAGRAHAFLVRQHPACAPFADLDHPRVRRDARAEAARIWRWRSGDLHADALRPQPRPGTHCAAACLLPPICRRRIAHHRQQRAILSAAHPIRRQAMITTRKQAVR